MNYKSYNKYKAIVHGFTVVELMIVIIVISILATLTYVAYKNVGKEANNTKTSDIISAYKDALVLYHAKYGKYPAGNADNKTCIGVGYPSGRCWKGEISENATFMQELKKVYGDELPMTPTQALGLRGAWFVSASDGLTPKLDNLKEDFIVYSVEGDDTTCPIGPVASDGPNGSNNDGNIFTFFQTPPTSGRSVLKGQYAADEPAQCWVPMSLIK